MKPTTLCAVMLLAACSGQSGTGGTGGGSASGGGSNGGGGSAGGGSMELYTNCTGDSVDCSCFESTTDLLDPPIFGGCGDPSQSLCCADTTWPANHTSCSCSGRLQWVCVSDPAGFCWCEWDKGITGNQYPSTCASDQDCNVTNQQSCWASGTPAGYDYCCLDDLSGLEPSCTCYNTAKWGAPPCPAGTTAVESCLSSTRVPAPSSARCTSTKREVRTCALDGPSLRAGIGDACASDADCESSKCSDPDGGYCTTTCYRHSDCTGDQGGNNQFGGSNNCVKKSATTSICAPDCAVDASMCAAQYGAGFDCITLSGVDLCFHP